MDHSILSVVAVIVMNQRKTHYLVVQNWDYPSAKGKSIIDYPFQIIYDSFGGENHKIKQNSAIIFVVEIFNLCGLLILIIIAKASMISFF